MALVVEIIPHRRATMRDPAIPLSKYHICGALSLAQYATWVFHSSNRRLFIWYHSSLFYLISFTYFLVGVILGVLFSKCRKSDYRHLVIDNHWADVLYNASQQLRPQKALPRNNCWATSTNLNWCNFYRKPVNKEHSPMELILVNSPKITISLFSLN